MKSDWTEQGPLKYDALLHVESMALTLFGLFCLGGWLAGY